MFRVLPIAMLTLVSFLVYKAIDYRKEAEAQAKIEKEIAQLMPSAGEEMVEEGDAVEVAAGEDKEETAATEGEGAPKEGKEELGPNENGLPDYVSFTPPEEKVMLWSESEINLLEKLQARRLELDVWEEELSLKEGLIEASSKKLDSKISQLEFLKTQTEELIAVYQEHDDAKLRSLVKIYETMKPKDAAAVFDQMNMDIMLVLVDRMSERRAAPILAKMNTQRARQITEKLANQRSLAQEQGIASN